MRFLPARLEDVLFDVIEQGLDATWEDARQAGVITEEGTHQVDGITVHSCQIDLDRGKQELRMVRNPETGETLIVGDSHVPETLKNEVLKMLQDGPITFVGRNEEHMVEKVSDFLENSALLPKDKREAVGILLEALTNETPIAEQGHEQQLGTDVAREAQEESLPEEERSRFRRWREGRFSPDTDSQEVVGDATSRLLASRQMESDQGHTL